MVFYAYKNVHAEHSIQTTHFSNSLLFRTEPQSAFHTCGVLWQLWIENILSCVEQGHPSVLVCQTKCTTTHGPTLWSGAESHLRWRSRVCCCLLRWHWRFIVTGEIAFGTHRLECSSLEIEAWRWRNTTARIAAIIMTYWFWYIFMYLPPGLFKGKVHLHYLINLFFYT